MLRTLTDADLKTLAETWEALAEDDYDGPETVMLSIGYVAVHLDGDVVRFGSIIANVSDG